MVGKTGKKTNYKRRYTKLRSKWYNKKYSVGDIASKALIGVKYLKGIINSELKTTTFNAITQIVDYNGLVNHNSVINQGDAHYQRQGNSVLAKYFTYHAVYRLRGASTSNIIACYIVMDTQKENGTSMTVSNMLEGIGNRNAPNSMLTVDNLKRFKILAKRIIRLDTNDPNKTVSINIKNIDRHIKWVVGTNNMMENHIYLVHVSDAVPGSSDEPYFDYISRLKYYDN